MRSRSTLRRAEDQPLPLALPELDGEVPPPPPVLLVEPGRLLGRLIPVLSPIRPIPLRFANRQVGQKDARPAVGTRPHARHLVRQVVALECAAVGDFAVDHHEVVRCRGDARNLEGAQPVAPIVDRAQSAAALGCRIDGLRRRLRGGRDGRLGKRGSKARGPGACERGGAGKESRCVAGDHARSLQSPCRLVNFPAFPAFR